MPRTRRSPASSPSARSRWCATTTGCSRCASRQTRASRSSSRAGARLTPADTSDRVPPTLAAAVRRRDAATPTSSDAPPIRPTRRSPRCATRVTGYDAVIVGTAAAHLRPEQAALARALLAANARTVRVALRTPWDIGAYPGGAHPRLLLWHRCAPSTEALAAALFGEIPFRGPPAGRDPRPVRARPRANLSAMALRDEILEQPAAAARLLAAADPSFAPVRDMLARRRPRFAVIAARGSSDNAALYAQYLFGIRNRLAVALATPSAITLYGARPDYSDALVIAISQSGRSPDIVAVSTRRAARARRRSCSRTTRLRRLPPRPITPSRSKLGRSSPRRRPRRTRRSCWPWRSCPARSTR